MEGYKMRKLICTGLILLFLSFSGCLWYQVTEYIIRYADDLSSGTITVRYHNIMTGENDPIKQKEDFDELLKMLNGDGFLLDQMKAGIYVQERSLVEENGQLNAYYSGIFRDLTIEDEKTSIQNNERIIILSNDDKEKIESNGKIIKSEENTILTWPKEQRDIYIKVTSTVSDTLYPLIKYYQDWKKE
jgi:hypothetical protein